VRTGRVGGGSGGDPGGGPGQGTCRPGAGRAVRPADDPGRLVPDRGRGGTRRLGPFPLADGAPHSSGGSSAQALTSGSVVERVGVLDVPQGVSGVVRDRKSTR